VEWGDTWVDRGHKRLADMEEIVGGWWWLDQSQQVAVVGTTASKGVDGTCAGI
jgi:hypothetical protein